MIDQLWESLLQFAANVVFLAGQGLAVAGKIIAIPGFIGLAVGVVLFIWCWKNTRSVVGALFLLFGGGIAIYFVASYLLFPFLFKGAANSLTSCYKAAGTNAPSLSVCDTLAQGFTWSEDEDSGPQIPIITTPSPSPNQVVRTFKANALEIMTKNWNMHPPDWPSNIPGQLVGPADLPQGITAQFQCGNEIATLKNEEWTITISGEVPGIGQKLVVLKVNGFFAKDEEGFNAKSGTSIMGTGTWEQVCPGCYTDVVVTPPPQPTATPLPPAAAEGTKVPFPQLVCGYYGWLFRAAWLVVPTTGGQPDFAHAVSQAAAAADIAKRCPDEALPAPP